MKSSLDQKPGLRRLSSSSLSLVIFMLLIFVIVIVIIFLVVEWLLSVNNATNTLIVTLTDKQCSKSFFQSQIQINKFKYSAPKYHTDKQLQTFDLKLCQITFVLLKTKQFVKINECFKTMLKNKKKIYKAILKTIPPTHHSKEQGGA